MMRVLVVRLGSMGDVIHALPAVAALRAAHPDAHIGWAIERRWTPLLVADETPLAGPRSPQRPLVDSVHVVNTLGWRRAPFSGATWGEVRRVFRDIRAENYEVAIDFQGSIKSAVVGRFSGAPTRIGFAQPREKQAAMFYTASVRTQAAHVIDQNLSLVTSLCPQSSAVPPIANTFPAGRRIWMKGVSKYAILNPGAGWGAKEWPAERYGQVARALRNLDMFSSVNYGPGEKELAKQVLLATGDYANAASLPLSNLIELTRRAALFIGGDTGPMHLANALGVPVVALFGPTDPARNGPYAAPGWGKSIVLRHPSSRNDMRHHPAPDPGLLAITADEVIAAMRTLLDSAPDTRDPSPDSASRAPLPTPGDPEAPR